VHVSVLTEPGLSAGDHPTFFAARQIRRTPELRKGELPFKDEQRTGADERRMILRERENHRAGLAHAARVIAFTALVLAAACSRKAPPVIEPPTPTPEPVVPVVLEPPPVSSWTIPSVVPQTRYVSEVTAVLRRDSAGLVLEERVETRGLITLQGRRDTLGAFRGTGVVDSFVVRGLERVLTPNQAEPTTRAVPVLPNPPLTVPFAASLDTRMIRISTRPPLANECDRVESGATNIVRDLVLRLPQKLSVGRTWQDSTVGFVCRLGVPITTRTRSTFLVAGMERVNDRVLLIVRKTTDITMSGELKSTWRTVTVNATGQNTQMSRVDAESGVMRSAEGEGLLTVKLVDTSRRDGSGTQEVRQQTTVRITARP
jgi:hypothetical protein